MADAIGEARKMYAEGQPWWSLALIRDLEERSDGLGYEWVEWCVRNLLPVTETGNKTELLADLDDLSRYRARSASPEEFTQMSREIWNRPNRDFAQTAISNLCFAAAARHHSAIAKSLMILSVPISLLIKGSMDKERHLNTCFHEYTSLVGRTWPATERIG